MQSGYWSPCWRALLVAGWATVMLRAAPSVHDLKAQYRFACSVCHGLDGTSKGPGGIKLPGRVLADRKWLVGQRDSDLVSSILDGKGAMPAFRYKLSPEEAKRLLTEIVRPMARKAPR